jgi:hypothetical protein
METTTETSALNLENKEMGTVEIKIEEPTLNNEEIKVNVTLKSPLISSLKTKLSYVYNKFMKLVSCTTNAVVDTTREPTTLIEDLINIKEPVVVEQEQEKKQLVVEEPVATLLPTTSQVEPVVVEQPVSIQERM